MKNFFLLSLVSLFLYACSEPREVITPEIPQAPVQDRVLKKGLVYTDNEGTTYTYNLSLPENYSKQGALPVLMYLSDDSTDQLSSHYIDNMLAECNARFPMIVYPRDTDKLFIKDEHYHLAFGLLEQIERDYDIADASKRMIAGFSNGASAAARAPIIHPGSYAMSFGWSGWIGTEDKVLFDAVAQHATELKALNFKAIYFVGDEDHEPAYDKLIPHFEANGIPFYLTVLENQQHNLGKYHRRTRPQFKAELCQFFAKA